MGSGSPREWVFGYGSLVADVVDGYAAVLRGHRRRWGVAMDNARDLPGYKWYRLRATGERPALFVAFLDVVTTFDGFTVNGMCHPVSAAELARLDARERNYERIDVTDALDDARGKTWAYVGSKAGRERLENARGEGIAAVSRDYLTGVEAGFGRLGDGAREAFEASTEPLDLPVLDLERIDLDG